MSTIDSDLPREFCARLPAIMGPAQALTALQYLREPRPVAWRVNRLLSTAQEVVQSFQAAGICWHPGWCDSSGWAPAEFRDRVTRHPMAEQGHIYIQGLASQFASILLAPQPGEVVLDLAAAPGGKASHLAELMGNQGEL
ncbi:MAG TPA: hypothetical protein PKD54_03825, partial [Pirellulaceae bacterium]|nr:hypothetical protein [Pirellulaceae bacterium]